MQPPTWKPPLRELRHVRAWESPLQLVSNNQLSKTVILVGDFRALGNLLAHLTHAPSKLTRYQYKPGAPSARMCFLCPENSTWNMEHGVPCGTWLTVHSVLCTNTSLLILSSSYSGKRNSLLYIAKNWSDIRNPLVWFHLYHYPEVSCVRQFPSFSALDMTVKYFSPWREIEVWIHYDLQQKIRGECIFP